MRKTVTLDVISDVMCPWCYIGKRRLETALTLISDIDVHIQWRPYQLDGTIPTEGMDRRTYLENKFGGKDRAKAIYAQIEQAGEQEGLDFQFEKIERSPNTLDCHRLIRWSGVEGKQDILVEYLFKAFFIEGADLTDRQVLLDAATAAGMDVASVSERLEQPLDVDAVKAEIGQAQQIGVTGVPCFIADQKYALMGAQDPQALASMIRQAAAEQGQESDS